MSKQVVYCYPATLNAAEDGYDINFLDFNCEAKGDDPVAAIENAREVLALHIDNMLKNKEDIPEPSGLADISTSDLVVFIDFNINVYRFKNKHKSVTRAVTLSRSLNELAKASDINVSAVLQEALIELLNDKEKEPK